MASVPPAPVPQRPQRSTTWTLLAAEEGQQDAMAEPPATHDFDLLKHLGTLYQDSQPQLEAAYTRARSHLEHYVPGTSHLLLGSHDVLPTSAPKPPALHYAASTSGNPFECAV